MVSACKILIQCTVVCKEMTSKLAKILRSLTKASNEKLDEVIASLEQEEPDSKPGI